jgi:hypothetical protein
MAAERRVECVDELPASDWLRLMSEAENAGNEDRTGVKVWEVAVARAAGVLSSEVRPKPFCACPMRYMHEFEGSLVYIGSLAVRGKLLASGRFARVGGGYHRRRTCRSGCVCLAPRRILPRGSCGGDASSSSVADSPHSRRYTY